MNNLFNHCKGNNISCTLWGQFASQVVKYEHDHKFGPIVVILTLANIQEAKCYPITIQNTMYFSKLFINDNNIQEIQVFTNSLGSVKSYESYNQCMSETFSCSQEGLKTSSFIMLLLKQSLDYFNLARNEMNLFVSLMAQSRNCLLMDGTMMGIPNAIEKLMQLEYHLIALYISRVFKIKFDQFLMYLKKHHVLGKVLLTSQQLQNLTLLEIENLLQINRKSLRDYPSMAYPEGRITSKLGNKLMHVERDYDKEELKAEFRHCFNLLTNIFNYLC
ncbi:hypothetical protein Lal_00041511 [Lupinus albus]|nr:hypothetical protein Lal_00041511 [Lupinus albus]